MTRSTLLTIEDLINELDMGTATLKFILHRFSPWFAPQIVNDETCYTEQAVTILLKVKNFLDTGMLPGQVEVALTQEAETLKAKAEHPGANTMPLTVDMDSASMFKDMFQVYIEKQDRIVSAQEALARVEERKADAMEKRAAAEEKKALAMADIALALQEMNQRHNADTQAMEIAGRAVGTMGLDESPELDENLLDTDVDEDIDDLSALIDKNDNAEDLDDLFSLVDIDTPKAFHEDIDDLSKLIEPDSDPAVGDLDNLSALIGESVQSQESMDDLSRLIAPANEDAGDLDDLSALVGNPAQSQEPMDDLSRLIAPASDGDAGDLDDLSALVGNPAQSQEPMDDLFRLIAPASHEDAGDLDDLSALVGNPAQSQEPMDDLSRLIAPANNEGVGDLDDLSALIGSPAKSQELQNPPEQSVDAPGMDNLHALVNESSNNSQATTDTIPADKDNVSAPPDTPKETPSIKPDISPDQGMDKYKAAVMKIIIELKGQGLTAQQATDRLNQDNVPTVSGKPVWGLKAIEKIYGFIDSAK